MALLGVSYFGNRYVDKARDDVKRIAESCDYIVHTVSETDLIFHKAVLGKIFSESRKAGLEVWVDPWSLGGVFGGEALSRYLTDHREAWQVLSDGRVVPAACLNHPEWRSFVKEWILTVRDMGAQVLFWDEPHVYFTFEAELQGIYSCVCSVCQQIFKKQTGSALPSRLSGEARKFRRQTLRDFLSDVMSFGKFKGLRNALCLYAYKGHEEYDQVWQEAASLKDLDIFGCDPYWRWRGHKDPADHVADFSRYVEETARKYQKGSQVWIQAMRLPAGAETEIHRALGAAIQQGVTHIAAWSYDGGELLDPVLSERPKEVWQAVEDAFKRIRENRVK